MDNCPERVDAEAPMPPRSKTAARIQAMMGLSLGVERMYALDAEVAVLTMRRLFWRARKKKKSKKKQELKAAGEC